MQNVDKQFLDSLTELLGKVKDAPIDQRLKCLEVLCFELNLLMEARMYEGLNIIDTSDNERYVILNEEDEYDESYPPLFSNFRIVNINDIG